MKKHQRNYTLCEVKGKRRNAPRYAENLIEEGQRFKTLRQTVYLSRPDTAKLSHVSLRTVHNWETGKVLIPYPQIRQCGSAS